MPRPTLHFEILRRIAETASGRRYEDLWFVVTEDETTLNPVVKVLTHAPGEDEFPDAVVIPCAGWTRPHVPQLSAAMIACGDTAINLLSVDVQAQEGQGDPAQKGMAADAVFWSASAVEKFLVPYYASVFGDTAPEVVSRLVNVFVPKGSPELLDNGSAPVSDAFVDDRNFAVIHLPSSEYADASSPGGVAPRLFALTTSGTVSPL